MIGLYKVFMQIGNPNLDSSKDVWAKSRKFPSNNDDCQVGFRVRVENKVDGLRV